MARNLERRPTHPGRLLRGEIEARELNQRQVADLVGVGRRTINAELLTRFAKNEDR